jgi:uncharacterized protein YukE
VHRTKFRSFPRSMSRRKFPGAVRSLLLRNCDDGRTVDQLDECRQDVVVAGQEEREAHKSLVEGRGPLDRDWSPQEVTRYRLRLDRWRNASRALVEALDRLERSQRELAVRHAPHDDSSAAP